jgi:hypothetical protein
MPTRGQVIAMYDVVLLVEEQLTAPDAERPMDELVSPGCPARKGLRPLTERPQRCPA